MSTFFLVLGEHGQLAQQLAKVARREDRRIVLAGRDTLDLIAAADPTVLLDLFKPDAVINAAAFSAVDAAQDEKAACDRLNAEVPGLYAHACARRGIPFVHFSSDYVFDGTKGAPYVEEDAKRPLNIYGASKAGGDDRIAEVDGAWTVLRTSWLFSATGNNFARTMLRLAETRDEIGVVHDQQGTPTHAETCAHAAFFVADRLLAGDATARGLFHIADEGHATWAELAETVLARAAMHGLPTARVRRITTADYPTKTPRPADSRLSVRKIHDVLDWRGRDWRDGVEITLRELTAVPAAAAA